MKLQSGLIFLRATPWGSTVVQQVRAVLAKPAPSSTAPAEALAAVLPVQVPTNVPRKVAEGTLCVWGRQLRGRSVWRPQIVA